MHFLNKPTLVRLYALQLPSTYTSLPRGMSLSGTPDRPSPLLASRSTSTYNPQPIISRISIPPALSKPRRSRPIPLSIIMRLQNPNYPMPYSSYPHGKEGQYQPPLPLPQDYLLLPAPPEQRQPEIYGEGNRVKKGQTIRSAIL